MEKRTAWLLLVASLPTSATTPRMRPWRAIKALGCAPLRDGANLLPGGQAWVMDVLARSIDDEESFTSLFDRAKDYAEFGDRLEEDPGLARLGALVHALDIGGPSMPEALGCEAIMSGARARLDSDDAPLNEIGTVFDSLYTHFSKESTT